LRLREGLTRGSYTNAQSGHTGARHLQEVAPVEADFPVHQGFGINLPVHVCISFDVLEDSLNKVMGLDTLLRLYL
jgi:hypothetical protein